MLCDNRGEHILLCLLNFSPNRKNTKGAQARNKLTNPSKLDAHCIPRLSYSGPAASGSNTPTILRLKVEDARADAVTVVYESAI